MKVDDQAIGRGICEVVDGLNLRDGGTTLSCPECCGGLSLHGRHRRKFCLTKPPAGTVKEASHYSDCILCSLSE